MSGVYQHGVEDQADARLFARGVDKLLVSGEVRGHSDVRNGGGYLGGKGQEGPDGGFSLGGSCGEGL